MPLDTFNPSSRPRREDGSTPTYGEWAAHYGSGPIADLVLRSFDLEGEENRRRDQALGRMEGAALDFRQGFAQEEDRLSSLFRTQSGQGLARNLSGALSGLSQSIGGRGIDPNSGAAQGALAVLGGQYSRGLSDARLGVALDSSRRREAFRNADFTNQQVIAQLINQSPSMLGVDALTNAAEFQTARYGADRGVEGARISADAQKKAAKMSGAGNVLGKVLPF